VADGAKGPPVVGAIVDDDSDPDTDEVGQKVVEAEVYQALEDEPLHDARERCHHDVFGEAPDKMEKAQFFPVSPGPKVIEREVGDDGDGDGQGASPCDGLGQRHGCEDEVLAKPQAGHVDDDSRAPDDGKLTKASEILAAQALAQP